VGDFGSHNGHIKDKITYTGAERVRKINISLTPSHNFNFMLIQVQGFRLTQHWFGYFIQ
jgi:hypothetical protein